MQHTSGNHFRVLRKVVTCKQHLEENDFSCHAQVGLPAAEAGQEHQGHEEISPGLKSRILEICEELSLYINAVGL